MPSLPASVIGFAFTAATIGAVVALAFGIAREIRRRERHRRRIVIGAFARLVTEFLDHRGDEVRIRTAARSVDERIFWTVMDAASGRARGADRRRLSKALERNRHSAVERRLLRHDAVERRELAAYRLGLLRSKRSRRALHRAMRRGPEAVTAVALRALARDRDLVALEWALDHPDRLRHRTVAVWIGLLRGFGRRAVPSLAARLERGIDVVRLRRAAIEIVGMARHTPSVAAVERHLTDNDVDVRVAAARALGRMPATTAGPALAKALGDGSWPVRALAAWALGRTNVATATSALTACMTDESWWVRRHAAYALAHLGQHEALARIARESDDPYAREIAQEALDVTGMRSAG